MNKHLAIYLPSLRGGGAERMMVNLAQGFVERGYAVDLVLAQAEGPYLELVPETVRVVDLKASRVLFSLAGLIRYLRRERPEAMLSAMGHVNIIALVGRALARPSMRLAISVRNTHSVSQKQSSSRISKILSLLAKILYPRADVIIAVSQGVADDLSLTLGIDREKISVAYNPVVTVDLAEMAAMPLNHPWFQTADTAGPKVILGVGRLSRQKNFPLLIRAFKLVREKMNARLIILGEGEERPNLEQMCRDLGIEQDVDLPGFVKNPFQYMSRAGVFVLSSDWEGLPGVLIQAMACGAPVVSTDCPSGPREILEDGKLGRLVSMGDVLALAEAIVSTLSELEHSDIKSRANDFHSSTVTDAYIKWRTKQ